MNLRSIFVGSAGIRAGWSVAIFIAIVVVEFVISISIIHALHGPDVRNIKEITPVQLGMQELLFVIMAAIPTYVMSRIERRPFLSYGFSGPNKLPRFLWGALSGFVALSALVGILVLAHGIVFDKTDLGFASAIAYAIAWFIVFCLVGIAEESMVRGYLLFTLTRGINFFWASILVSLLFGFMHSGNGGESLIGLAGTVIISLVFCLSVWLTGSLYWAVGIHAAWDWSQSYLYGVADSGLRSQGHLFQTHATGNVLISGGSAGPEASIFCWLIVLLIALGIYLVWGRRPALQNKGSLFAQSSSLASEQV